MDTGYHIPFENLVGYIEGRLTGDAIAEVEAHLGTGCSACAGELASLRRIWLGLSAGSWAAPPKAVHRRAVQAFRASTAQHRPLGWKPAWSIALATVAFLGIIILALIPGANPGVAYAATLTSASGPVEIRLAQGSAWQPALPGQSVPIGAEIRAGATGKATLSFPGGDHVALSGGGRLKLANLTHQDGRWKITVVQAGGFSQSNIQPGTSDYRLETPAGAAVASMGRFTVALQEDGTAEVNVDEGNVSVEGSFGASQLAAGQEAHLRQGGTKPTILTSGQTLTSSPRTPTAWSTPIPQGDGAQGGNGQNNEGSGAEPGTDQNSTPATGTHDTPTGPPTASPTETSGP